MKRLILALSTLLLAACATSPELTPYNPDTDTPSATVDPNKDLMTALGMYRLPSDLGSVEKRFDPCSLGVNTNNGCSRQYFTVVHFQLLCRDSEGTLRDVPTQLMPIVASKMEWQLGGRRGATQTDSQGFGQFSVITSKSTKNQRLILHLGPQFVGFNVSEVAKVVLPKNFCRDDHA